ncbi:MAG TPA: pyocin knob domain-containing protein [Bacteroidales bacterium]|nr:pyocin knob domain-containing protein [Bacteroidales bacterium]
MNLTFLPHYFLTSVSAFFLSYSLFSQTLNVPNGLNGIGSISGSNVGIGTTNPLAKLDIEGLIQLGWNDPSYGVGLASSGAGGGGWARRYGFFKRSDNTLLGGFGAMGLENTLNYLWIGNEYNNYSAAFYPNGPILLNGNIGVNGNYSSISSIPATGNIELATQGAGIIMKDETTAKRYHLHFHGDQLRQWDGSTELTYLTNSSGLSYGLWTDLNGILTSHSYQNLFGWTNTNCPGGDGFGSFINIGAVGDRYGSQLFVSFSTPELWFRQINNGTTRGWKKIANSDNPVFTGNVGIGKDNPTYKTHIANINLDNAPFNTLLAIDGNTNDESPNNIFNTSKPSIGLVFRRDWNSIGTPTALAGIYAWGAYYWAGGLAFTTTPANANGVQYTRMVITDVGNIGIGNTAPGNYRLNVSGKIRADEIVVNTEGADFVFQPEYKLSDLSEVEKYINENDHLPDIPSAEEMKTDGMSMSEMQTKLLQKIEELTLYIIEQDKRINDLEMKHNQTEL